MNPQKSETTVDLLKVGIAQIAPIWLNRERTLEKMISYVDSDGDQDCRLLVFGEAVLPGYPFWIERTDGARFDSALQKDIHAHYMDQAVQIEAGHLDALCEAAGRNHVAVYAGFIERPLDRGGHSLYCSLVYIDPSGHYSRPDVMQLTINRKRQSTLIIDE